MARREAAQRVFSPHEGSSRRCAEILVGATGISPVSLLHIVAAARLRRRNAHRPHGSFRSSTSRVQCPSASGCPRSIAASVVFHGGSNDWSASSSRLSLAGGDIHLDRARGLPARRSVLRPVIGNVQLADRRRQSRFAISDLVASDTSQTQETHNAHVVTAALLRHESVHHVRRQDSPRRPCLPSLGLGPERRGGVHAFGDLYVHRCSPRWSRIAHGSPNRPEITQEFRRVRA